MPDSVSQRIQQLENQVNALQQLLLSHILAFDEVDRQATDGTFTIAINQLDAALDQGKGPVAVNLADMIQSIQSCRAGG